MALLEEMSKLNIALKVWRSPVADALHDSRFFSSSSTAGRKWRPIVRALVGTDKSAFMEILGFSCFNFQPEHEDDSDLSQEKSRRHHLRTSLVIGNRRCFFVPSAFGGYPSSFSRGIKINS